MKKLALCLMAIALCTGTAAAQDYRGDRYDRSDRYDRDDRGRYDDRDDNRYRERDVILPRQYMRQRYVFDGWRDRGLTHPTAGQHWVRVCDAFILVSSRSGRVQEVHMAGRGRVDNKPRWRLAQSLRSCERY
jgi:Ni/Co efflux regulator RcnB